MKTASRHSAFTLIELLVVIAIIGILSAIALPTVGRFRAGDALAASTRQLLDDVARARQYAMSQRTTVYMVFCPTNFWTDAVYAALPQPERDKGAKLYDKQLTGYNFVTLRGVGEQPGKFSPRYLSSWKVLPEGAIIPHWKFTPRAATPERSIVNHITYTPDTTELIPVYGFRYTNNIPFPSADTFLSPGVTLYSQLPYIAFNHLGQLESGEDEYIPVARGSVSAGRDANKIATQTAPNIQETPAGNSTNAFMLVHIDHLTGRARLVKQEFP